MENENAEIKFKTGVTSKLLGLVSVPLAAAAALAYFAVDANAKFAPSDPSKLFFVGIPACISAFLFLTVALSCLTYLNRKITLKGEELLYTDSKVMMTLKISEMAFSPPSKKTLFKTISVSDGKTFVQIPELFLGEKEFAKLTKLITNKRRKARVNSSQKTYSL